MVSSWIVASLIASPFGFQRNSVKVVEEPFKDWKQAVRISNSTTEIVVVPEIGRVVHFGYLNKPNLLWMNPILGATSEAGKGYRNFGGDKVWHAPQSNWNWPPDPAFDGRPMKYELIPGGIRLISEVSDQFKLQITREVTLVETGTTVKFLNKLQNLGPRANYSCWQVTQIQSPTTIRLNVDFNRGFNTLIGNKPDPIYHVFSKGVLTLSHHPKASYKFGTITTDGKISALVNGEWFVMRSELVRRATYPDQNSAQEVYTNAGTDRYVELEQLSPLISMDTREVALQRVEWRLQNAP